MSRVSIVSMLVAAEVLIVGMAIYAVGGHGRTFAGSMHRSDFTASPIAPVAVGAAPHVVIDDPESRVHVDTSSDQLVHVRDLTQIHGWLFSGGRYPQLVVSRTSDGVRIERLRTSGGSIDIFGFSTQAIDIDVPQAAQLEIARCSGADVRGVTGGVNVHSVDGHVTLTDLQGSVDARSDDGSLEATNVRSDRLSLNSMDGRIALQDVAAATLSATTRDGRILADGLRVGTNATLQTDDGSVRVRLAPNANLTIDASTRDGSISVDGSSLDRSDDSSQRTIRLGSGSGQMKLATADGSIRIFTNGEAQNNGL
jgi:Putative adhesin